MIYKNMEFKAIAIKNLKYKKKIDLKSWKKTQWCQKELSSTIKDKIQEKTSN